MKKYKFAALFVMLLLLLSACGKSNSTSSEVEQSNNELVLGIGYEPDNGWDPIYGSGHYGSSIFQSALLKRDMNLEVIPDLAQSYEISEDKLTYTVNLRQDVKWSDGSDFSADDVVFTYNLAKQEHTPGSNLERLDSVNKVDDYTVEIKLNQPDISFLYSMCSLAIVPNKTYSESYGQNPIGTGPFKMVEWEKGQQMIVEPNEYYYGEKVPFDKITFLFFKDTEASLATAKAGVCDIIKIPYTANDVSVEGFHVVSLKTIDNRGIALPTQKRNESGEKIIGNDVTSDVAIRKALNIAMNRQEIIDNVLNGEGTVASSVADAMPWFNEKTIQTNDGDLEKASQILDEANWVLNDEGIREKDGLKAEFDLLYAYKDREHLAIYFKEQAKKIGINVNLVYGDWDYIDPKLNSEAVLFGWGGYDPLEMYYNYSSKFQGWEYYNANYYSNPKVDEYFEAGLSSSDINGLYDNFKLAQWDGGTGLSWLGDCPWIWLVNENHLYLVRDGLEIGEQKVQPHGGGWPLLDTISNWKWENEK